MRTKSSILLSAAFIIGLLNSCSCEWEEVTGLFPSVKKAYEGPDRLSAEVQGSFLSESFGSVQITVEDIDRYPVYPKHCSAEVLPGDHWMAAGFKIRLNSGATVRSTSSCNMFFDAKPLETYEVGGKVSLSPSSSSSLYTASEVTYTFNCWIKDKLTGEIVSSPHPFFPR